MDKNCRTCLKLLDPNSSVLLTKRLSLGKTVEEIILLFIPQMMKSILVDDFICSDCFDTVEIFAKFIERCIQVEKFLKEKFRGMCEQQRQLNNLRVKKRIAKDFTGENCADKGQGEITAKEKKNSKSKPDDRGNKLLKIVSIKPSLSNIFEVESPPKIQSNQELEKSSEKPYSLVKPQKTYSRKEKLSVRRKEPLEEPDPLDCTPDSISSNTTESITQVVSANGRPRIIIHVKKSAPTSERSSKIPKGTVPTTFIEQSVTIRSRDSSVEDVSSDLSNATGHVTNTSKEELSIDDDLIDFKFKKIFISAWNKSNRNGDGNFEINKNSALTTVDELKKRSERNSDSPVENNISDEDDVQHEDLASAGSNLEIQDENSSENPAVEDNDSEKSKGNNLDVNATEEVPLNKYMEDKSLIENLAASPYVVNVNLNHNRLISMSKTNEEVADLVKRFSHSDIKLMKAGLQKDSGSKRIIFLGNAFHHCPECKVLFSTSTLVKYHFRSMHPNIKYPMQSPYDVVVKGSLPSDDKPVKVCPVCGEYFSSHVPYYKHLTVHKDYYPHKCEDCGKEFKEKVSYTRHRANYNIYKNCNVTKCYFCKDVVLKDNYVAHSNSHRTFQCEICKRKYASMDRLDNHMSYHKKPVAPKEKRKELCSICGKLLSTMSNMLIHLKSHSENRDHECEKCSKRFKTKENLTAHTRLVHGSRRYECSICQQRTKTKTALVYHKRLKHSNVYSITCNICGAGFIRSDYYRRHMNNHLYEYQRNGKYSEYKGNGPTCRKYIIGYTSNENDPLPCKYCPRKYRNVHALRIHIGSSHLKNTRARSKCQYCNMTFSSVANKLRHEKRHENPKEFELTCKVCWNRFSNKEALAAHSVKHKGSQKRKCEECGETFPSKYLLYHHKGEKHFNEELANIQRNTILDEGLSDYRIN